MNMLLLGGNNPRHHQWLRELGAVLESAGHKVFLHDYAHWNTGAPLADIDTEVARVQQTIGTEKDYVIIAKSIGTVIATIAINHGMLRPQKCLLLGTPITGIAGDTPAFAPSLAALPRTVFVQNEHDPYGSADTLNTFLQTYHPAVYELDVVFNNYTHDYVDFEQIRRYFKK